MLKRFAVDMAETFFRSSGNDYSEGDVKIYAYGLEMLLSTVLEVSAVLILGIFMGKFYETVAFFIAFIPIRSYAGGYHAKTHLGCFVCLLVVYVAFLISLYSMPHGMISYISIFLCIIPALTILVLAPIPSENKPIGPLQHKKFRRKSLEMLLIQMLIIIGLSVVGIMPYIYFSLSLGLLTAAGSLVVAYICK